MMRTLLILAALTFGVIGQAVAGDLEDGVAAYKIGDFATAVAKFRSAAERGEPVAQFNLGYMYRTGQGVALNTRIAAEWYEKAATQGHSDAQYDLGVMLREGEGLPQDDKKAAFWHLKSAEQGDALTQYNLGLMYYYGRGVAVDYVQAWKWWSLAEAKGIPDAKGNREFVEKKMTPQQLEEAKLRVAEWTLAHKE